MEFINLYLIITEYLSLKNINLQESILFYYLKYIFQQLKPGKSLESHKKIRILVATCYERTRDQGTLGSIAIAIIEPLGGHLFMYLIGYVGKPPRGGSAPTNIM
jgi:hypothetical protein